MTRKNAAVTAPQLTERKYIFLFHYLIITFYVLQHYIQMYTIYILLDILHNVYCKYTVFVFLYKNFIKIDCVLTTVLYYEGNISQVEFHVSSYLELRQKGVI